MTRSRAPLLLGFFILAYILPLNCRPLIEPDETRYAEIPRAMADGGNWLELRLVGLPYYEKPPLGYWLGAASISALGHHNLAVRLPMALAAGGAALTIFLLVRARRRRTDPALGAAAVYLAFFLVFGIGTFAVLDSIFTFFVTLSLALFFQAINEKDRRPRLAWLALSGLACAGGFLTKGFTALVLPVLILAAWLPWRGLFKKHLLNCLVPVLVALLAVLPIALALHRANPASWNYCFWVEHIQRFLEPGPGQHDEPFWLYLPWILAGALPWTFCLPRALGPIRAKVKAGDGLTTFCLAWLALPFLFFSACGGKIATYILPCFPPLAILLAEAMMESPRDFSPGLKTCAALFLALALGAVAWLFFFVPPELLGPLLADIRPWVLVAGLLLTAAGLGAAPKILFFSADRLNGLIWAALATLPLFLAASHCLPEVFINRRSPSVLLAEAARLTPPGAAIFTDRKTLYAAAWHYRQSGLVFAFGAGELAYGLDRPEGEGRFVPDADGLAGLIRRELAAGRPAVFIVAGNHEKNLSALALSGLEPDLALTRGDFSWRLYQPKKPAEGGGL
ncbi:MAG: phospholipid carrier-dependent glycosyltransferase [Candidatus Adiutrix sp.]|jgi:4-amino-4-deoxy-L-arabinose transferase|nr:phospholipid carrier-dependent glycosyltransferase [Candidatus Adiutrix sp.]